MNGENVRRLGAESVATKNGKLLHVVPQNRKERRAAMKQAKKKRQTP